MWLALLGRFWRPLAAVVLVAILWLAHSRAISSAFHEGYAKAQAEDAQALAIQIHEAAVKEAAQALRSKDAHDAHETEVAELSDYRPLARPFVVCHAAPDPGRVPEAAGLSASAGPAAPVVPANAELHPDIAPALELLARRADRLAADARELNTVTHP